MFWKSTRQLVIGANAVSAGIILAIGAFMMCFAELLGRAGLAEDMQRFDVPLWIYLLGIVVGLTAARQGAWDLIRYARTEEFGFWCHGCIAALWFVGAIVMASVQPAGNSLSTLTVIISGILSALLMVCAIDVRHKTTRSTQGLAAA